MATYKQIAAYIKDNEGWTAETCWIAHCKELNGLPVKRAPNRQGTGRMVPCPPEKRTAIKGAFRHFGMIR